MPDKNVLKLYGQVGSVEKSHEFNGECFYRFMIHVKRNSGTVDVLPVIVNEKLLFNNDIDTGDYVYVAGQIRTKNSVSEDGKNRLLVFGYATEIEQIAEEECVNNPNRNYVELEGYVCKKPNYRETPSGRKITDLLLASNRPYNKSDYVPSIAWGINAAFAKNFEVGTKVLAIGRFQSRPYKKKKEDGTYEERVAYELSISNLEIDWPEKEGA